MNENRELSFFLLNVQLNEAHLGDSKEIKSLIEESPKFNMLTVKPDTMGVNVSFFKPKKKSELAEVMATVSDCDYIIDSELSLIYLDSSFEVCSAIQVSSSVEVVGSEDLSLTELDKFINKKSTNFLQPIVSKGLKVLADLFGEVNSLCNLPTIDSVLKTLGETTDVHIPTK